MAPYPVGTRYLSSQITLWPNGPSTMAHPNHFCCMSWWFDYASWRWKEQDSFGLCGLLAGTQMIEQGMDGLSIGNLSSGVVTGEHFP